METSQEESPEFQEARIHDETVAYFSELLRQLPDSDSKKEVKEVFNAFFTLRYGQRIKKSRSNDGELGYGLYPVAKTDDNGHKFLPQSEIDHVSERINALPPLETTHLPWPEDLVLSDSEYPMHVTLSFIHDHEIAPELSARLVRWVGESEFRNLLAELRPVSE